MKHMTVFNVYTEDYTGVYKMTVPAQSKADAIKYVEGNGKIISVKIADLQYIDLGALAKTLKDNMWGQEEIDVITRALIQCGLERR